ncbi:MAG TPA: nickel pincer cofactor biosynthesis protein LarC [Polyangiaceae bacterium]|nr:nickel pincer cofactor biosynthesis protein LarC [Polyangiaceae bacterium]
MSESSGDAKKPRFRGIVGPAGRGHSHGHGPGQHTHDDARQGDALRFGNPRLERGAGQGKLLFFDCFSGVAGDMTVAALVDLGVPFDVVSDAIAALGLSGVGVQLEPAQTGVIGGVRFVVTQTGQHPERSYREIARLLDSASLDADTKQRSQSIFRRLAEAEAFVHRMDLDAVTFHEVGAVDAIADVVGAAAALAYLQAELVCAPLPMGHGSVVCRHGVLPLPAPATVACLRGVPTYDAKVEAELVTPTGAAIVASQARRFERWPSLQPLAIGWGAGTRQLPDRLNALRVVLGDASETAAPRDEPTHFVIEANIDDMTGELASHAIAKLLDAGALDAWALPITMKKGRPGLLLSALATTATVAVIETVLLRETSSIGLRRIGATRTERPRELLEVETEFGKLPVKVARGPYGPPQLKPEFDACAAAAALHQVPVRTVLAAALAAALATSAIPAKP